MKRIVFVLALLVCAGCRHGDFKAEAVIKGQPAPFAGYNIGPELWVEEGQPCPVFGAVIWVKGLEPNDIVGGEQ